MLERQQKSQNIKQLIHHTIDNSQYGIEVEVDAAWGLEPSTIKQRILAKVAHFNNSTQIHSQQLSTTETNSTKINDKMSHVLFLRDVFEKAGVDTFCNNEYLVHHVQDTIFQHNKRQFHVFWTVEEDSKEENNPTWEPMEHLYGPIPIIDYFDSRNLSIPDDVKLYLKRFTCPDQLSKAARGKPYKEWKIKRIAGSRRVPMGLEKIPPEMIGSALPSPNMYVRDEKGILFRLVYPSTFHISDPVYHEGKSVNCFGSVLKHIWG